MLFVTSDKCKVCYYMRAEKISTDRTAYICKCPEFCENYNQYLSICNACKYKPQSREGCCEGCIKEDR